MTTFQISVLFGLTAGAVACFLGIYRAVQRLSEVLFLIRNELTKINSKLERVEIVDTNASLNPFAPYDADQVFEVAIDRAFERLQTGGEKASSDAG